MDVEKLIEQLNGYFEGKELGRGAALDAATGLSTFQAENEKLRAELEQKSKLIAQQTAELERRDTLLKEQETELEWMKEIMRENGIMVIPPKYPGGTVLGVTRDRLRELIQADNEGRCVVMPCQPGYKISYISSVGLQCNAVIKDYTPENIFITAETEISNAKPLSHTFSILEIEAALRREKE